MNPATLSALSMVAARAPAVAAAVLALEAEVVIPKVRSILSGLNSVSAGSGDRLTLEKQTQSIVSAMLSEFALEEDDLVEGRELTRTESDNWSLLCTAVLHPSILN